MIVKSLCVKDSNQNIEEWLKKEDQELEEYFEFAINLIVRKILKQNCSYGKSLDGENMPIDQLLKLAIKYRLNCAENQQQRDEQSIFLLSIDFDNEAEFELTPQKRQGVQKFLIDECDKSFQQGKEKIA